MLAPIENNYVAFLRNRANEMRANPTESERRVHKMLIKHKVPHQSQVPILINDRTGYIVDFLLPKQRIIEVDGSYHNDKEQIVKDKHRDRELVEKGYHIIRITNEQTHNLGLWFFQRLEEEGEPTSAMKKAANIVITSKMKKKMKKKKKN